MPLIAKCLEPVHNPWNAIKYLGLWGAAVPEAKNTCRQNSKILLKFKSEFLGNHLCAGPTGKFCVWITPGVQNTYLTLTVMWQLFASEAVNYTVKYSTQPGEVNNASEGALEVIEISGTSTILTALERGTTYYIWVVGVSEGGKRLYSDRKIGVTFDSELHRTSWHCQRVWHMSKFINLYTMHFTSNTIGI